MGNEWKVSLHGGHSREFCEHAFDRLEEMLQAAERAGYSIFGVTEHAPRGEERFLYPSELEKGYTVERLEAEFHAYSEAVDSLRERFSGRMTVLKGFETEVVPRDSYVKRTRAYRDRFGFDYMVGSVHHVDEVQIDGSPELFTKAVQSAGGLEALAVRYYETVAEMIRGLRPEVVGHFDLVRRNAPPGIALDSPPIQEAARRALEIGRDFDSIMDLNTAGYRKGLGGPYPAPWIVRMAADMGIGFCFGDDSHSIPDVGAGLPEARRYLLEQGVDRIRVLIPAENGLRKEWRPLSK